MLFREHKGNLSESMKTVVELESTRKALSDHITKLLSGVYLEGPLKIKIEHVFYDKRCEWDVHCVSVQGFGPVGYTDRMPD